MKRAVLSLAVRIPGLLLCLTLGPCLLAQTIQVTSATPSAAPEGSVNLNVSISGSGFDRGAQAQFFITGTANPGGVTVNSTKFVNKQSLTANITIADSATIANFDVQVTSGTRTGKGTEMFAVTSKGTPIGCTTSGTPSGATLQAVLNPVQPNGAALITTLRLGNAISVRPLDLNSDGVADTLAAFVTSGAGNGSIPGTYVFLLDPASGVPQANNPITGSAWQSPQLLLTGVRASQAAAGDVNGDKIPDFASAGLTNTPYLFVGRVDGATHNPSWAAHLISPPAGSTASLGSVAFGDVDGIGRDEIVVAGGPSGRTDTTIPAAFIFQYSSGALNYVRKIQDPTGSQGAGFGHSMAVGNASGQGIDLVVGAPSANTNGLVYVFPHPVQQSSFFTLSGPGPNFGRGLGIADVNLDTTPDLVVITGAQGDSTAQALIYAGVVHPSAAYTNQLLPSSGLGSGWGTPNYDVANMLAAGAVAVGAPNASTCSSIQGGTGAVHLFTSPFSASERPNYVFETPSLGGSNQFEYGYGVGIVPGYPFLVIGEHYRDVGTTSMAGQVYVYKLN